MQEDTPVKPWVTDDFHGTEYSVYQDGALVGTWYGTPGSLRWSQFCNRCNSYFTRMLHNCPKITEEAYCGTIPVPPTHPPPVKDVNGRLNAHVYEARLVCGHVQYVRKGAGAEFPCPECS